MCGKRLNAWKTMPMRRRIRLTSTRCSVISSPSTKMRPRVDRLEQVRRSGAASTCPSRTRRSGRRPRARRRAGRCRAAPPVRPKDLWTPSEPSRASLTLSTPAAWRRSRSTSQSVNRASGIVSSDEEQRGCDVRRVVEGCGSVDLRLLERLDGAEDADERGVLLQPDEVVEERRDHPAHGLRERRRSAAPAGATARASAPPPPGSGARTRCRRGRPRTRTRCRRARARRFPRTSSTCGTPCELERRRAEAEHRDHEDRRHAAEEVGVDDRRARGAGRRPGPAGCGSTASSSAKTRMNTSAIRKIFTLSRNAAGSRGASP